MANTGNIDLQKILFIDIETVSQYPKFENCPECFQNLWEKKFAKIAKYEENEDTTPSELYSRAGIYAEFGKIICISVGFFKKDNFYLHSFVGDDEKKILAEFSALVDKYFTQQGSRFCGHNIKEFDLPYIVRRMLVNQMPVPKILNLSGMKPWDNPHLDTLDMWKFGDYKHYTSLELLAYIFGIPTPKDDINGSMVGEIYWNEHDLQRIATYCQKDTLTTARVFMKLKGLQDDRINDEKIIIIK